jgi:hypothetical protein
VLPDRVDKADKVLPDRVVVVHQVALPCKDLEDVEDVEVRVGKVARADKVRVVVVSPVAAFPVVVAVEVRADKVARAAAVFPVAAVVRVDKAAVAFPAAAVARVDKAGRVLVAPVVVLGVLRLMTAQKVS